MSMSRAKSLQPDDEVAQAICCQGAPCQHPEACRCHENITVPVNLMKANHAIILLMCQRGKAQSVNHTRNTR